MSSMTFGQKKFVATPPEKGSFPLDHSGVCKIPMLKYMVCLRSAGNDSSASACRAEAHDYLECRMKNNLMTPEEWKKLGFPEFETIWLDFVVYKIMAILGTHIVPCSNHTPSIQNNINSLTRMAINYKNMKIMLIPVKIERVQRSEIDSTQQEVG
ncbi:hypothetical protein J437_LFUL003503 [Ladona fulva]|uniref:Cytochrome c oxidase assembly protein COX19 n=1 Tax=Ladona fulva TaxID=123851 RepID=A0A8K0NUZ5_LADFU|nr:hypothetical protein J437_LFUL003503 [Ladona fulva]